MVIETTRFGAVEVQDTVRLEFPEGILGFDGVQEYCLLQLAPDCPFQWLQAVTDPALAFLVLNPFDVVADYDITLTEADTAHLKLESPEDIVVLAIVTLAEQEITANLVGPIVVNRRLGLARQVVLSDASYPTRHRLCLLQAAPTPAARAYSEVA